MFTLKKINLHHGLKLLLLTITLSCGTWAGNPTGEDPPQEVTAVDVTLELRGVNKTSLNLDETILVTGTEGETIGSLNLTGARIALEKIKLEPASGTKASEKEFEGPYIVDLLNNTTTPSLGKISIGAGSYKSIKLSLAKVEKDRINGVVDDTDPIIEKSVHLVGTYTPVNGDPKDFEMDFELSEEFFIPLATSNAPVEIKGTNLNTLVVSFGLHKWFNFVGQESDFSKVTGTDIILMKDSEESAKKVREIIKENIKDSAEFSKADD